MTDHTELRRKAEAATPGPWSLSQATETLHAIRNAERRIIADVGYSGSEKQDVTNGEYIAAACPATVIALLDEINALKAAQADMVLVPRVPTEAMVHAAEDIPPPRMFGRVYTAMIEAATKEKT